MKNFYRALWLWMGSMLLSCAAMALEQGEGISIGGRPRSQVDMPSQPAVTDSSAPPSTASPSPRVSSDPPAPDAPSSSSQSLPGATSQETSPTPMSSAPLKTGNLWDRIRSGFAMPNLQSNLVLSREQWYASRPDYIARMVQRSSKYLFHIVEELEARKMPTELALLPFIESAFNPQAVSTAKAAGIWQFIPSTGKAYALKQTAFQDERRDVLASTRAALDYLQRLYAMFGDWHLALASYNWGEGSVSRALAKNQNGGLGLSYADLTMPSETRNYVPKLQAVKNIIANPQNYGLVLPEIADHPYFKSISIHKDMDVQLAAKLADMPMDDFKDLNPSLKRPVIFAASVPQIFLPWEQAETFNKNFANYSGRLASWTAWSVPRSIKPREAARQMGMSERGLRDLNQIPTKATLIKAGSILLVPRSSAEAPDAQARVVQDAQLNTSSASTSSTAKKRRGKTSLNAKTNKAKRSAAQRGGAEGKKSAHKKKASNKKSETKKH